MKRGLVIVIIIIAVLVIILGVYFYFAPEDNEGGVPFDIEGTNQVIVIWDVPLNEDSAKRLGEKAIDTEIYSIGSALKDESNMWSVSFNCIEETTAYLCGGIVLINETNRKVYIRYLR